jgi:hypothetical protein
VALLKERFEARPRKCSSVYYPVLGVLDGSLCVLTSSCFRVVSSLKLVLEIELGVMVLHAGADGTRTHNGLIWHIDGLDGVPHSFTLSVFSIPENVLAIY